MESRIFDLLVIGGGINGAGIARDAALRGLSVLLCEKDDLAQHTSSASTKLIHGGLRYLEYYQFGLVRKSLQEREVLLRVAPHLIRPLRFVMPHDASQRPAWMIRCGLFLYDHLARRELLPGSASVSFRGHPAGVPLRRGFTRGFEYSDGCVQDARLVVLNALDAAENGAEILTRTACIGAVREGDVWRCSLRTPAGAVRQTRARVLVNAAGPWVERFLHEGIGLNARQSVRLVKGSHIIVRRLFDHPYAYLFQNPDKRIIFAIPYEQDFTLIGTTDVDYHGDPGQVSVDDQEIRYLCNMSNRYFEQQIRPADVVASFSGVRPLLDDQTDKATRVTRDYSLVVDLSEGAPLLSVYGGKITTYRLLAEQVLDKLAPLIGNDQACTTGQAVLPGGDLPGADPDTWLEQLTGRFDWMPVAVLSRYVRAYGTRLHVILGAARSLSDLGTEILPGLYEAEARYLVNVEWARTAEDILWRRSKLRLKATDLDVARLERWLRGYLASGAPLPYGCAATESV
jgi:glycerol-3-phosphate dehydrogenase